MTLNYHRKNVENLMAIFAMLLLMIMKKKLVFKISIIESIQCPKLQPSLSNTNIDCTTALDFVSLAIQAVVKDPL